MMMRTRKVECNFSKRWWAFKEGMKMTEHQAQWNICLKVYVSPEVLIVVIPSRQIDLYTYVSYSKYTFSKVIIIINSIDHIEYYK